jgi:hypothetical protein
MLRYTSNYVLLKLMYNQCYQLCGPQELGIVELQAPVNYYSCLVCVSLI